jgi:hypothetical protein
MARLYAIGEAVLKGLDLHLFLPQRFHRADGAATPPTAA